MSLVQYDSERFVTACAVSSAESMAAAVTLGLKPEHFATPAHAAIFGVAHDLFTDDLLSSPNVVRTELISRNLYERAGGDDGWSDLLQNYGWEPSELPYHVRSVVRAHILREGSDALSGAMEALSSEGTTLTEKERAVELANTRLLELSAEEAATLERGDDMAKAFRADFESDEVQAAFSPSGFPSLDARIGGLPIGRVTTVAAFTSQGKSAFTDQLILNHARRWLKHQAAGKSGPMQAVKFSPEVPNKDSRLRVVANLAEVDARAIEQDLQKEQRLPSNQREKVMKAIDVLEVLPATWDERSAPTVAYMRARLLAEQARCPIGLAVFDYLEMTGEEHREKRIKLEKAMIGCHNLARDLGIPFVVVAQINRAGHNRPDGVPHLSDLAETSMIEKVSSLVIMLHHPHTHWNQTDRQSDEPNPLHYNVLVRKNTRGPLGSVGSITWRKECLRFYDEADHETRSPATTLHDYTAPF